MFLQSIINERYRKNMSDKYITVKEAADILSLHPRTATRLLISGKLKGAKIGKSWRIDEKDVHDFFEQTKAETAEAIKNMEALSK